MCVCVHAHRILLLTEELASNSSAGGGSPTSFLTRITCFTIPIFGSCHLLKELLGELGGSLGGAMGEPWGEPAAQLTMAV